LQRKAGLHARFSGSGFVPAPLRAATTAFSRSASVALPGPRGRTSGADGLQRAGALSASAAEAVRGCSSSAVSGESDARHRRPGSRRSTSAWTVYALAASHALPFQAPAVPVPASPVTATPGRAAVTSASNRAGAHADPERASSERVDGERGPQSRPVCGPGAARLADIPALFSVSAPHITSAPRTTTGLQLGAAA
jgi:hypothetical protein